MTAQSIEVVLVGAVLAAATYFGLSRLRLVDALVRWQLGLTLLLVIAALSQQRQDADPVALAATTVSNYIWVLIWILAIALAVFFPVYLGRLSGNRRLHRAALVWSGLLWWGLIGGALATLSGSCGPLATAIPTSRTTVICESNLAYGFVWALAVVLLNLVTLVSAFVIHRRRPADQLPSR